MSKEDNTKELDNLKEIIDNPTKPALEIDNNGEVLDDTKETIDVEKQETDLKEDNNNKKENKEKDKKNKKKLKDKIKEKWNKFSKKEKTLIIIFGTIVLILIVTLIVVLVSKNKDTKSSSKKKPDVIIEKDNYRYENGNLILLDENDKDLGKYECKNQDEKLCYVAYFELDEHIDKVKVLNEEGKLVDRRTPIIDNKYAFIYDNEEGAKNEIVFLYDIKEQENIGEYTGVKLADKDKSIVKDKAGSYGVIKINEGKVEELVDFNYDDISLFNDDIHSYYMVNDNGRNYLMNDQKKAISKAISSYIADYNDKYIVGVNDTKEYFLYDYNNKMIFSDPYQYIKIYKDYVALVKDNKLYIRYYDKNRFNEVGLSVNSKFEYFNEINVVDEDNKVLEEYVPFKIVQNATTLTVTIDKKDYVISLKEAEISKNTEYVSYFDGTLYIYSDIPKENLIGEYKCTNPNNLTSDSTKFVNCFIASDTVRQDNDMTFSKSVGVIPIINNRYVFIQDNPNAVNDSNRNIVLYDLNDKKVLSKYLSVNTNMNSETEMPTYRSESDFRVIAQNRNSKYGILTLNGEGKMASLVPFNYSSIENMGNSYLAYDGTNYTIFARDGKEMLSKRVSNRIRGFNTKYIKVKEGNTYHIYDYAANKLTKNGFKYIQLQENYYVGISSDNKLNIYSYDKDIIETPLINDSIQLINDKYCGDDLLAFKVSIVGENATVYTLNSNEKYDATSYPLVKPVIKAETNTSNNNEGQGENESVVNNNGEA
ncbi:MAG: hypothetical protein E7158_05450 [Firmicutes bacterium]|nr:hypothetical protein [Bacillota bacterium]